MNTQTDTTAKPSDLLTARAIFRLGLFLVLGAVAFFLRYTFEQGWIGPLARVGMAAGAGLAMIVAGTQISLRRPAYGNVLQGGGAAVLYLTAFAAHQRYGLIDPTGAFVALAAISVALVALSLRHSSQALAISGVAGALAAPVLIGGRIDGFVGDAGYLIAVLGAAGALYLVRRWSWLFIATGVGVSAILSLDLLLVIFGEENASLRTQMVVGIVALWIVGWGVAIAGAVLHPAHADTGSVVPAAATGTLPLFAALGVLIGLDISPGEPAWMITTLSIAAIHTVAFFLLRSAEVPQLAAAIQLVPASMLTVLAWIGGLDGAGLLAAVAAQAAIMIVVGIRAGVGPLAATGHGLAGVVGAAWAFLAFAASDSSFTAADAWTGVVVLIAAAVALIISEEDEPHRSLSRLYASLALPAALAWAATSLSQLPGGEGLVTGTWALIGIALIVGGRVRDLDLVRNLGIAVMMLTVAKLLLVDLVASSPLIRIGLFAGIGVALLGVGYWLGADEEVSIDEDEDELLTTG
jgi:uncharacterized membrane protein